MTLFAFSLNLPMLWLTERVNLRHCIICVPLKVPQIGESRSGFPSTHENSQVSARREFCEQGFRSFFMLGYIKGRVLHSSDGTVLLENNGIGYEVLCSGAAYAKLVTDGQGEVYTYLQVRDDGISLTARVPQKYAHKFAAFQTEPAE